MKFVEGRAEIEDLDAFITDINKVSDETGSTVQCFNADYVAGERHLRRAAELARRATDRGTTIARDPAVELLVYAAGRRQINRALEMGVSEGELPIVSVVDGGDETAATNALKELLQLDESVEWGRREILTKYFDISESELAVVDGDLEAVVLERVALLAVET